MSEIFFFSSLFCFKNCYIQPSDSDGNVTVKSFLVVVSYVSINPLVWAKSFF